MPISQFNGLPRGGKTYYAMKLKALEAARTGHRILTNVEGINAAALSALVGGRHVEVVVVRDNLWNDPTIYPETIDGVVEAATHPEVQIRGGDYLILDECHGIWKASNRVADELHPRISKFFRYHGKYTGGPLNHSIEICLITHSPDDLPASIRRVVDATYLLISMRNLGMAKRFRGVKYARDTHVDAARLGKIGGTFGEKIEPRIYNTYQSFSHQEGGEVGAAASSGKFKAALVTLCVCVVGVPALFLYGLGNLGGDKAHSNAHKGRPPAVAASGVVQIPSVAAAAGGAGSDPIKFSAAMPPPSPAQPSAFSATIDQAPAAQAALPLPAASASSTGAGDQQPAVAAGEVKAKTYYQLASEDGDTLVDRLASAGFEPAGCVEAEDGKVRVAFRSSGEQRTQFVDLRDLRRSKLADLRICRL